MQKKRAICLAGGGPAAGLHIGVLKGLKKSGISFDSKDDVWALSCIGAWVGVAYNQAEKGNEIAETIKFFKNVFRDDKSFESFPTNTIFAPDWFGNAEAMMNFMLEPRNYRNAIVPKQVVESFLYTLKAIGGRIKSGDLFSEGDFNRWTLNHVLAVNPVVRFWTAMIYKSHVTGLARLYYPDSGFLNDIKWEKLNDKANTKPFIYHNAWNLTSKTLALFANRTDVSTNGKKIHDYKPINAASLCACSALPFIEQTVKIDGDTYCEGALIDTVNFDRLLEDNPDVEEIWISRLLDAKKIPAQQNLYDAQANLCELFAATVGEDDIKIFLDRFKAEPKWQGKKIIEVPVSAINFEWSHSNLELGIENGEQAAEKAFARYEKEKNNLQPIIKAPPDEIEQARKSSQRAREQIKALRAAS